MVTDDASLGAYGVTAAHRVTEPGIDHQVASPFWAFMNTSDVIYEGGEFVTSKLFPSAFYATGYPVTEAFWAEVKVGGVERDVLVQAFEPRVLTYTPDNPLGWQVEAGNVGQHYYSWRYDQDGGEQPEPTPEPTPDSTPEPTPEPTPTPDPDPTPEPTPEPASPTSYIAGNRLADHIAEAAPISEPLGIAVGPTGDVFVTRNDGPVFLQFSPDGLLQDTYPILLTSKWGIDVDDEGRFFVASNNGKVRIHDADNQPLDVIDDQLLTRPTDLVYDPTVSRLYVLDMATSQIRLFHISPEGTASPIAFEEPDQIRAQYAMRGPNGIDIDAAGNIYVADTGNHVVKKFAPSGDFITEFGGYGEEAEHTIFPRDIVVSPEGLVYVLADGDQNGGAGVKIFEPADETTESYSFLSTWGEDGVLPGQFDRPSAMAMDDDGYLYITEQYNNRIQKFTTTGELVDLWTSLERGKLSIPAAVERGPDGLIYALDVHLDRVTVYTEDKQPVRDWTVFNPGGTVASASNIGIGPEYVYVSDSLGKKILVFNHVGLFIDEWKEAPGGADLFSYPTGIDVDAEGNVYVVDNEAHLVRKFTATGEPIDIWGGSGAGEGQFTNPIDIAIHDGFSYVTDFGNDRIQQFDLEGNFIREWGSTGVEEGQFNGPSNLAVDDRGYVYVTDHNNGRIQKFTAEGEFYASLDAAAVEVAELALPTGITVDSSGRIYVVNNQSYPNPSVVEVLTPVLSSN